MRWRHSKQAPDEPDVKRFLPLITAFILSLYMAVPGDFDARYDDTGAAVTEQQDDAVFTSPKQDDHIILPDDTQITLLAIASSGHQSEHVRSAFSRPSVPNIRDPPRNA